jgi:ferrous iron transport protein B
MPATAPAAERRPATAAGRVALLGNPNTGKTTLFNVLCGARAKTSNFPGTTTTIRTGRSEFAGQRADVVDLPGVYDLRYETPESIIARDVLSGGHTAPPDLIVVLVDACNLTRNLVLVGELLGFGQPIVVALNMVDLAQRRGLTLDTHTMSRRLGVPVIATVARKGGGLEELRAAIADGLSGRLPASRPSDLPVGDATVETLTTWADSIVAESARGSSADANEADTFAERLDRTFTHPVLGVVCFVAVMAALFYTLFTLATVPMDLIEATFAVLGDLVRSWLPEGPVRDLLTP